MPSSGSKKSKKRSARVVTFDGKGCELLVLLVISCDFLVLLAEKGGRFQFFAAPEMAQ